MENTFATTTTITLNDTSDRDLGKVWYVTYQTEEEIEVKTL